VSRVADGPIRVKPLMAPYPGRRSREPARRLIARGATEYDDVELFERVRSMLDRAATGRSTDVLLVAELLDGDVDWELDTQLKLSSHRPAPLGPIILFMKRRFLLPISRWLFEYSRENFRRQQRMNRILLACIEQLAIENASLRQDLDRVKKP
jgi:hypothetical protein